MLHRRFRKILTTFLALTMLLSLFPAASAAAEPADSVYRNGNIYMVDEDFSTATAIAIKGDRLVYVGDEAGVEAAAYTEVAKDEAAAMPTTDMILQMHLDEPFLYAVRSGDGTLLFVGVCADPAEEG